MRHIISALIILFIARQGAEAQYTYATLDYPGAANTFLSGIDGNVIVGSYSVNANSPLHGFIFDGSTFTAIDFPGSRSTVVTDIDDDRFVGYYDDQNQRHGFLYENGVYTALSDPLADPNVSNGTEAHGVSGNKVVGGYYGTNGTRAYLYDSAGFHDFTNPYSATSAALGIDGSTIVGWYQVSGNSHGYIFDGSTYATLDYPSSTSTLPLDVSNDLVVGYYIDASNKARGFTFNHGTFTTLNEPSSIGSQFIPNGSNGTTLVGQYRTGTGNSVRIHGFITVPEPSGCAVCLTFAIAAICIRPAKRKKRKNNEFPPGDSPGFSVVFP